MRKRFPSPQLPQPGEGKREGAPRLPAASGRGVAAHAHGACARRPQRDATAVRGVDHGGGLSRAYRARTSRDCRR